MKIISREWSTKDSLGKRIRHVAYGYTAMVRGKRERKFSSAWRSEADALKALNERQQQIQSGQITQPAVVTLGQAVTRYLTFKSDKRSLANDRLFFEKHLLPFFGANLPLRQLTAPLIAAYEEKRRNEVGVCAVRNELACLRHLLRLSCERWGFITVTPKIDMPKAPKGRTRFLSEAEIGRLLTACRESKNSFLYAMVVLAINTGMRKGEILGLTWEHVDLARDLGFGATATLYDTKSGDDRGVPLNQAAIAALVSVQPDPQKRLGRVFKRSTGENRVSVRTAWERALLRADIPNFRFHDLRHTCASYLTMRGRPMREVQEVLGHKSLTMTLKYSHLSPKHLRTAVESLEGLTGSPLDPRAQKMAQEMAQSGSLDDIPASAPQKTLIS